MTDCSPYDAVVIGGGPAGIVAAHALASGGRRTVLLEAGSPMRDSLCPKVRASVDGRPVRDTERLRMQCARCTCLTGLGGAAFHFDTNLGDSTRLRRSKLEAAAGGGVETYSTLERALASFERADHVLRRVFELFYEHGLPREPSREPNPSTAAVIREFDGVDLAGSQSITVDKAIAVVDRLIEQLARCGGETRFHTRAMAVDRGTRSRFVVTVEHPDTGIERIDTDAVVIAVGKLGLPFVRSTIERLSLDAHPAGRVDLGVRVEGPRDRFAPLVESCANPKLAYVSDRGETVRTFCVCSGGRLMQYDYGGAVILDGQHSLTTPTGWSNFGILTTMRVPPGLNGTDFALALASTVSDYGHHRPVACTVGELATGQRRPHYSDLPVALDTSLLDFKHAPLSACLPGSIVADVLEMVARLNRLFPGMIDDHAVVAAPVIERVFPELVLSEHLESSEPGLYFAGDASSKIIGVTYGAATGLVAAAAIVQSAANAYRT